MPFTISTAWAEEAFEIWDGEIGWPRDGSFPEGPGAEHGRVWRISSVRPRKLEAFNKFPVMGKSKSLFDLNHDSITCGDLI